MARMPSLFVSHGAPNLILYDSPATRFLSEYAGGIEKPAAILSVSAHFETDRPAVVTDPSPETVWSELVERSTVHWTDLRPPASDPEDTTTGLDVPSP